jgi:hypothetical protein
MVEIMVNVLQARKPGLKKGSDGVGPRAAIPGAEVKVVAIPLA